MRKECPEIGWGDWKILKTGADGVLAIQYSWKGSRVTTIHNFSEEPRVAHIRDGGSGEPMVDLLGSHESRRTSAAAMPSNSTHTDTGGSAPEASTAPGLLGAADRFLTTGKQPL